MKDKDRESVVNFSSLGQGIDVLDCLLQRLSRVANKSSNIRHELQPIEKEEEDKTSKCLEPIGILPKLQNRLYNLENMVEDLERDTEIISSYVAPSPEESPNLKKSRQ